MPHEKSLKYAWESRNGDCGRLGSVSAIILENNSSMTSQLSLNLLIFRTVYQIFLGMELHARSEAPLLTSPSSILLRVTRD